VTSTNDIKIYPYRFSSDIQTQLHDIHYIKERWPIVYILVNDKTNEAYIGETTDLYTRLDAHLKDDKKKEMTSLYLIISPRFNKSIGLDIESDLIRYMDGDGIYKLTNGNGGITNRNYYEREKSYQKLFEDVWSELRSKGIVKNSIKKITNSDLFRYSPYKDLNDDQIAALLEIINSLLNREIKTTIVEGGAGTGKTILAIFLFKLLHSDIEDFNFQGFGKYKDELEKAVRSLKLKYSNPTMALVIPMASFRKTVEKVFKHIKGLSKDMVIAPAMVTEKKYDIILADESHRLRRRAVLGSYFGTFDRCCSVLNMDKHTSNELNWLMVQSDKLILLYDEEQSIKPADIRKAFFDKLKNTSGTVVQPLNLQLRIKGGNDYVEYVRKLLSCVFKPGDKIYKAKEYSFLLFDSIEHMIAEIKLRDEQYGLSRLAAGYSWKWVTKKKKRKKKNGEEREESTPSFDISIENVRLKWNSVMGDWINKSYAINEVGCIHTTQGYDLNYAAIIFGNEISYDKKNNKLIIRKENYHDRNGKIGLETPEELNEYIHRIYSTLLKRGIRGTYVYACDPDLREYFAEHIEKAESKSVTPLISSEKAPPFENAVRFYDINAAAGNFSDQKQAGDYKWIQIPAHIEANEKLFACRVIGESMNKIIPNGSICLFTHDEGGSRNGRVVLVRHANIQDKDFGYGFTVKEYRSKKKVEDGRWAHEIITLHPRSTDDAFQDIIITHDELNDLKVIGIFKCVIY